MKILLSNGDRKKIVDKVGGMLKIKKQVNRDSVHKNKCLNKKKREVGIKIQNKIRQVGDINKTNSLNKTKEGGGQLDKGFSLKKLTIFNRLIIIMVNGE